MTPSCSPPSKPFFFAANSLFPPAQNLFFVLIASRVYFLFQVKLRVQPSFSLPMRVFSRHTSTLQAISTDVFFLCLLLPSSFLLHFPRDSSSHMGPLVYIPFRRPPISFFEVLPFDTRSVPIFSLGLFEPFCSVTTSKEGS